MSERAARNEHDLDPERAAFEAAHAALGPSLARYAAAILGPGRADLVPDVLQDTWARAWAAWPPNDPDRRDAWLFRIVRNRCLDAHRAGRRDADALPVDLDLAAPDDPASSAQAGAALAALGRLPVALRETLWLRAVGDHSYAEIAELQGVPIGTVMSRLHAARTKLAKELGR